MCVSIYPQGSAPPLHIALSRLPGGIGKRNTLSLCEKSLLSNWGLLKAKQKSQILSNWNEGPSSALLCMPEAFLVYPHPMARVANTRNFSLNFSYVSLIIRDKRTLTTAVSGEQRPAAMRSCANSPSIPSVLAINLGQQYEPFAES